METVLPAGKIVQALPANENELSGNQESSAMLAQSAEKYKGAVGVVTGYVELLNGTKFVDPIGTAWAFDENKFATNAHVALAMPKTIKGIITRLVNSLMMEAAEANGCKNLPEFQSKIGPEQYQKLRAAKAKEIGENIRNIGVTIIMNGTYRKVFAVTHVQVHTGYGVAGSSFDPDMAVLTVQGRQPVYFKLAPQGKLQSLKPGEPVALLGFPMENLVNDNLNQDTPVATMQTGIVVAVSDFDMKNAGAEGNLMIRHNLPTAGGASGSPIFNRSGEVIALHYGGNYIFDEEHGRIPVSAQVNRAVRIDLLSGMGEPTALADFIR